MNSQVGYKGERGKGCLLQPTGGEGYTNDSMAWGMETSREQTPASCLERHLMTPLCRFVRVFEESHCEILTGLISLLLNSIRPDAFLALNITITLVYSGYISLLASFSLPGRLILVILHQI